MNELSSVKTWVNDSQISLSETDWKEWKKIIESMPRSFYSYANLGTIELFFPLYGVSGSMFFFLLTLLEDLRQEKPPETRLSKVGTEYFQ